MRLDSKIYVAGNKGLVGSSIVRRLKSEGYNNLVFTELPEYDLRNQQQVKDFFEREKPEYVFLAAAKVGGILANNSYPAEFIYDNLMIQSNVINAAYENNVKKLLFLGSSCIYPKFASQPISEDSLLTGSLEPTNEAYALAKISGLKMCDFYRKQYGCDFISAMPTNLYGQNDNFNLETSHVLPALIRKIFLSKCLDEGRMDLIKKDLTTIPFSSKKESLDFNNEEKLLEKLSEYNIIKNSSGEVSISLWGSGSPFREFLHVDDLADGLVFLMKNYSDFGTVNLGTGTDISIKDLALLVKDTIGFKGEILWDTTKPDGTPKKLLNTSKLEGLGWKYKIDIKDGVKSLYEWYLRAIDEC